MRFVQRTTAGFEADIEYVFRALANSHNLGGLDVDTPLNKHLPDRTEQTGPISSLQFQDRLVVPGVGAEVNRCSGREHARLARNRTSYVEDLVARRSEDARQGSTYLVDTSLVAIDQRVLLHEYERDDASIVIQRDNASVHDGHADFVENCGRMRKCPFLPRRKQDSFDAVAGLAPTHIDESDF